MTKYILCLVCLYASIIFPDNQVIPVGDRHLLDARAELNFISHTQAVELEPLWTVETASDENDVFHLVRDIALSDEGVLYVSDGGNNRIVSLSSVDGSYQGHTGRAGAGPGEFTAVSSVATDGSLVYASDVQLRRISMFSPELTYVESFSVEERPAQILATGGQLFLTYFAPMGRTALLVTYDTTGNRTGTLGTPREDGAIVDMAGESGRLSVVEGNVLYAHPYPYSIDRLRGEVQETLFTVQRDGFEPPADPPRGNTGMRLGAELPSKIRGLAYQEGLLFIQVELAGGFSELDVRSMGGGLLMSLSLPDEHRLGAVKADTLYTFVHGADETEAQVAAWRIVGLQELSHP